MTNKKWLSKVIGLLTIAALSSCDRVPFIEFYDSRVPWNIEIEEQFTARQNQTSQGVGSELMIALKAKSDILAQLPEEGEVLVIVNSIQDRFEYNVRIIQEASIAKENMNNDRILRSKSKLNCAQFPEFYRTEAFLNTFGGSQGELLCISKLGVRRLYFQIGDVSITPTALLNPRPKSIRIIPWNAEYELE